MALANHWLTLRVPSAFALILMFATSVRAQTAGASPAPSRWQVEIYVGPLIASRSGDGVAADPEEPERFTAVNGRPSAYVPSWYYGYGALLLGAVNTAVAASSGTVPLDDTTRHPMMQRTHGWHAGARLMRTLNPYWSMELAGGYATNGAEMLDEARRGIEETRDSFVPAWESFLRAGGHRIESISSVAEFEPASLRQTLFTGSLLFQLMQDGRLHPYLTAGGGVLSSFGDLPRATLTGRYQFLIDGVAPVDETDTSVVRFEIARHAFVVVAGTGVTWDLTPRWGVRADLRAHMMHNSIRHLVDGIPASARPPDGAARGVTAPDAYLSIQHSTTDGVRSSLSATAHGAPMYSGRGGVAAVGLTAGMFWRF